MGGAGCGRLEEELKLFLVYLKQHFKSIIIFILFSAVFAVTFALYGLPFKAVLYPAILCAVIGAVFIAVDYSRVLKRHRQLRRMRELAASLITSLPVPDGLIEEDYQTVIENLRSEVAGLEEAAAARYSEMTDYYTMWVHQIKTPISSMRLTLQNEDSVQARRLSSDLFRIEQYVEMVLAFLRLDSVSTDYVFKEHSLDDIIKQAVKKFAREFISRKLRLIYKPVNYSVVTDDKWLGFVLEQVLSNALKYTREGGVSIYMEEKDILCIEDTGIGIAPEDLPRIFEKGYTGYNGRTDKRASGLGLYLCRRICKNLGAEIWASSHPGKGTVIHINLAQYQLKRE